MNQASATAAPTPEPPSGRINLLGMPRAELERFFAGLGEKPWRAKQVMKWIYHAGVDSFEAMTDISKLLRARLTEIARIDAPPLRPAPASADGTRKWAVAVGRDADAVGGDADAVGDAGGDSVEAVLIPESGRNTLCISSQVGCVLDCTFCATGKQGFNGNLDRSEIVGQVWAVARELEREGAGRRITNVVFMGMGEPLYNIDAVVDAAAVFADDLAFGISRRRVTVSTAGVVPGIVDLAERSDVSLAVSLHAARDELRDRLVPLNRRYPIADLLAACRHYLARLGDRRSVTIEYTLIEGVNDSLEDAADLARLLRDLRCKVNLIPFNPFPASGFSRPSMDRVRAFQSRLLDAGLAAMLRTTRGDDITAACGQLVGRVRDRTRRQARYIARVSAGDAAGRQAQRAAGAA